MMKGAAIRLALVLFAFMTLTAARDPILVPEVSQHEVKVRQGFIGTELLLFGAILLMIVGGISLIFGFYARAGALMLFAFTVCASVLLHDYWHIRDTASRAADYDIFARNMAIAGGLLLIVGMGAGPFSIDNKLGDD